MKTISRILTLAFGLFFLTGCEMLNTEPQGGTKTEGQKADAIKANPELLAADVAALYSNMIELMGIFGETGNQHDDFGYASICLIMDQNGQDMTNICGYGWYSADCSYSDRVYTSTHSSFLWRSFYKQIRAANAVLTVAPADVTDETLKAYRGQALAIRAFDYLNLAQLYQFNYKGNEDKPCVPIVTEKTTQEEASKNPRATVKSVYGLIIEDLTEAIKLLDGYNRSSKGMIDQSVAYGLRARANLVMQNWGEAAADAGKALSVSGATPYTLQQVSVPTFASANANSVLWANIITETNDIVKSGIVNWPSHLCSLFSDGYVGVGDYKKISALLYDKISDSDVRKGWWLDDKAESPLLADSKYDSWKKDFAEGCGQYGNVKFGLYQDNTATLTPAQDWILMRAEEMIFIQAEGLAMSGNPANAKSLLDNFVRTNRDAAYAGAPADAQGLQNEIWMQRRVELWGEGFSFFDIMRLKKPIIRKENGVSSFPDAWQFNIPAEAPILLWLIPQMEIEANDGISEGDNNKAVNPPTV